MAEIGSQCCDIQLDLTDLSDLCELMPKRLLVSGILVQWLRQHFSSEDSISNSFLDEVIWTDDISTTAIAIDTVFKWNPGLTEKRPGIFIKPGPWKIVRYGIDDRKMMNPLTVTEDVCCWENRIHEYNTMIQGSHTIFCIAGESAEVEILADEVLKEMIQFGPVVRREFGFLRFVVSDMGEPSILEEATENFVVPIVVSYGLQDMWRICPPCCIESVVQEFQSNLWKTLQSDKLVTED